MMCEADSVGLGAFWWVLGRGMAAKTQLELNLMDKGASCAAAPILWTTFDNIFNIISDCHIKALGKQP